MKKSPTKIIHPIAGAIALLLITSFLLGTIITETLGDPALITLTKEYILYGICLLIPATIATGGSGFRMTKHKPEKGPIARKLKRMKMIGANGLMVLLPCAITLDYLASAGDFGTLFHTIQTLELIAGPLNLLLMGLNMKDGLAITASRRKKIGKN